MTETEGSRTRRGSLERWSPRLFVLGGLLVLGSALNNSLIFYANAPLPEPLGIVLNMAGFVAALVGVVGFYPELSDRIPRLAKLSLGVVAAGIVGIVVLAVWAIAMLGIGAPEPSPVIALLSLFLMLLGLCLFGVSVLRTDVYAKPVGVLLLALVAVLLVVFARSVIVGGDPSNSFIIVSEGVESALLLGIGYFHSASPTPAGREDPSPA